MLAGVLPGRLPVKQDEDIACDVAVEVRDDPLLELDSDPFAVIPVLGDGRVGVLAGCSRQSELLDRPREHREPYVRGPHIEVRVSFKEGKDATTAALAARSGGGEQQDETRHYDVSVEARLQGRLSRSQVGDARRSFNRAAPNKKGEWQRSEDPGACSQHATTVRARCFCFFSGW